MAGIVSTVPSRDIADIKEKTGNLPSDPADQSEVEAAITAAHATTDGKLDNIIDRLPCPLPFWSLSEVVIDLPVTVNGGTDKNLPDVEVSGIPTGATILRVVAVILSNALENTSAGGANAIKGAQAIRVLKDGGSWGVDDIPAIDLPDNLWTVAASTRESGRLLIGDNDLKTKVDGNGTYHFRFEDAIVDYDYLRLNDVQMGLWFYLQAG